jgi:hypothetical protein
MPDEKYYVGTLLKLDEARRRLPKIEAHIMDMVYWHWQHTVEELRKAEAETRRHDRASAPESASDHA